jgi:autotransporter-associated beta strand protein
MRRTLFVATLAVLGALTQPRSPVAAQSWTGPGTDWNTAGNWSPQLVPNSAAAVVNFNSGPLTVNISSGVQAQSLNFGISNGSFTITANSGQVLYGLTAINVAANVNSSQAISLPSFPSGDLLFAGGTSNLTITNNSPVFAYSMYIGPSTVVGTPGTGGVVFNGPGNSQFTGSFATGSNQVVGGLTKNGPGTLSFYGDGSNLRGGLTITGGTLSLDYSSNSAVKLGSSGPLTLGGGLLSLVGNSSASVTQNIPGGTVINAGQTDIQATLSGGTVTLNLNGLTRSVGGTVDVNPASLNSPFTATTTANASNGLILGPGFLTVNGGASWGSLAGTTIYPFSGPSINVFNQSSTNTDVTQSSSQSNISDNSLRFNTPDVTLTLSGTNTVQSGGILVTGNAFGTVISGGTLTPAAPNELIVHVYGDLTINSAISSAAGLTKTGPGPLTLGGFNTGLTGPINVNRGSLTATSTVAISSASQINFNDNHSGTGLQELTVDLGNNVSGTVTPPIRLSAFSSTGYGTFFSTGQSTGSMVTLQGVISSAPGQVTPIRFTGSSNNTSGFYLTNVNTFTGNVSLYQGTLGIPSDGALGNPANVLTLEVGSTTAGGLAFLDPNPIVRPVVLGAATRIVSNGSESDTIAGPISGPAGLYKAGSGTLNLAAANTYTGGTFVNAGTLAVNSDSALGTGNVTVGPFGTMLFTGTTTTSRAFTLTGGALAVAPNQTVMLNAIQLSGGYLGGGGTFATSAANGAQFADMTSRPAVTVASNSPSDQFTNFTNGGAFNVAANLNTPLNLNGFTNQGSGSVLIGAGSQVNASDFQTYGTLTLTPGTGVSPTQLTNAGLSNLFFNGGSRAFISIPAHAGLFDAGIDLHGQNAVVAGGLFVNNGYVVDSVGAGQKTVIADFGSLVKGAGFYQNSVQTINGGKFQSGNSPGQASFGSFTFGPGGVSNYVFAIDDASGVAGPSPDANGQVSGWGLVKAVQRPVGPLTTPGDFAWTADAAHPLSVALDTLVNPTTEGTDVAGQMAGFDPSKQYLWSAVQWTGAYSGPADPAALNAATAIDTSGFLNPIAGTFGWNLDATDHQLSLVYTPSAVPEPGGLALTGLASLGLGWAVRRCRYRRPPT